MPLDLYLKGYFNSDLTFTIFLGNSAVDKINLFTYFIQKIGFDTSCKLSAKKQFAWNAKSYFLVEIRKIFKKYRPL